MEGFFLFCIFISKTEILKNSKGLYLIAILPPQEIRDDIKDLKEEIKSEFHVSHALKLPAHITLQRPFWVRSENEKVLISNLANFAASQSSFQIELNGFDTFSPRVVFVKISNHQQLIALQNELQKILTLDFFLSPVQKQKEIHPHITLATRDLKQEIFPEVWSHFKTRFYQKVFQVHSIVLFKHDGKRWHKWSEFFFNR